MPFSVSINKGAIPASRVVPPAVVVAKARGSGRPNASKALAVTIPTLRIDQTGLHYDLGRRRTVFRFRTGVLKLTLRQEIYLASDLTACARGHWEQHERDHARDNQRTLNTIERAIRAHPRMKPIFITPSWHPRGSFNTVQGTIGATVGDIFLQRTTDAIRRRDTTAEYARINRRILTGCPDPFYHVVVRRETLSWLARFYYGRARLWPAIYRANRALIGRDPDLIHPKQRLLIPKQPKVGP